MTIKEYYTQTLCQNTEKQESPVVVFSAAELTAIPDGSTSRLLLDMVLNRTLEYESVLDLAKQKLVAGGELLVMLGSIAPEPDDKESFWGFTLASANYIFGKHFAKEDFVVHGFGNVLVGRILLTGGSAAEMEPKELDYTDPYYPVYVGVRAVKR